VRDTGIGIAPEDVAHIFDRFFRVKQKGTRRGTGLGLDFCREVVQAHGGRIWAESTVDVGTTFHFTIPLEGKNHEQMAVVSR
jgi:signal transduction histidine kinase